MIISVHQPQYLPWLGFFDKIDKSNCFVFLDTVQYKVREFQNRNKIRTKDGWIWLTVPVKHVSGERLALCDVEIDNSSDWAIEHSRSLEAWYMKAPYFKTYFPFFEELYRKRWDKLIDLNIEVIQYILSALGMQTPVKLESEIGTTKRSTDRIIEICGKLGADTYLSGSGGKEYLEEEKFEENNIKLLYQDFRHPQYQQRFIDEQHSFLPYMCIVDLLFNEGGKSLSIIRGQQKE
ncbi:MAG: WbqC family protein [Candidatus Omnitrophica bacterium]|nr:WbqC family protein [Candidatus Omnitrophota bacterium]MBU1925997.1 WbqC family protein [Candidatus Omnitrophota bacterium]